jgi:RNA polymerase sigma-70 factor (ECF subfamily)
MPRAVPGDATPMTSQAATLHRDHDESGLLRRVAQRDRAAFEALYAEYLPRLQRFLSRMTWRAELRDELVNDTLWIVWQKAGDFRGASLVSTWIFGIAYRCALKALSRERPSAPGSAEDIADGADEPGLAEQRDWIEHGLRLLPRDQRVTLELAYFGGHSCEEIAQVMDCAVGTVKARMFHARVKLRNLLPALGGADGRSGHAR